MTNSADVIEAQRIHWDACVFQAREGDMRLLLDFLRQKTIQVEGIDLARLADVIEAKEATAFKRKSHHRRGRPAPTNDVYVLADRGRVELLVSLIQENSLSGDVPDMRFIADWLSGKALRGRPRQPKLIVAVRRVENSKNIETLVAGWWPAELAIEVIAELENLSIETVKRDYTAWKKSQALPLRRA